MPRIAVITDSSACLPPSPDLGIRVLPILIRTETRELTDGMPEAPAVVYDALRRGETVKSSAPTAAEYLHAIEDADADAVLVITPATEFTGMLHSAEAAARLTDRRVAVLDSRTAAAAQGLVALAAAGAAAVGASLDEVIGIAENAARRVDLVAALESVEFVRRSGRVPPMALELARRLGVRPVFRLHEGAVERIGVPRSADAAMRRIRREWAAHEVERSVVFHAAASERAAYLRDALGDTDLVTEFSPSMGIHTGPGVVGVAWLRR